MYSYLTTMPSVSDWVEGIEFFAGQAQEFEEDQVKLNRHVPARLDRFVDGVRDNDLVLKSKKKEQAPLVKKKS